jgi:uncharacterized protein
METPCTKICLMDSVAGICIGCGRTLDEIARWGGMRDDERAAIMRGLGARLAQRKANV